jgi:hypothetical protein
MLTSYEKFYIQAHQGKGACGPAPDQRPPDTKGKYSE